MGALLDLTQEDWVELEREYCSRSFANFVRRAWSVLEPTTRLEWGWAMDAICDHLQGVSDGEIIRLLMNVPPGSMKSLLTGVFFPAYEWGPRYLPQLRYLGTAHKQDLAVRDNVKCRRLIESAWYRTLWPHVVITDDQNMKTKFENEDFGFREAMAFTSLTGSRGDRVLLDDPLSVDDARSETKLQTAEETFLEALPTRVNNKRSAIVVIMQRLHMRDISGIILAKDLDYVHLMLPMEFESERCCYTVIHPSWMAPDAQSRSMRFIRRTQQWVLDGDEGAIATLNDDDREAFSRGPVKYVYPQDPRTKDGELMFPDRWDEQDVRALKATLGSYAAAGQLQQRPAPREGGLFKREWFNIVRAIPQGTQFVRGWDLAASADQKVPFTAGVKIGRTPEGRYIVADSRRGQMSPGGVERFIRNTASEDGYGVTQSIPQDPGQAGKSQVLYFAQRFSGARLHFSTETGSKVDRAEPLSSQAEAGNVDILVGHWNEIFLDELCNFPNAEFADQVDAASRAFAKLVESPYTLYNVR